MADDDTQRNMLNELGSIIDEINKEIKSVKDDGVPKDIRRKLVQVQSRMNKLIKDIRNVVLQQTSLGDFN
tara:strand:- start:172 stop:381 length:210 start_codon:yes stop_codon:yes gene_type:complete